MKCPNCEKELNWGGDHDYEDYGYDGREEYSEEGEGIVSNSTCNNDDCDVDMVIIYTK